MSHIRMPERYKAALLRLASLNEQSVTNLLSALHGVNPSILREDISEKLASSGIDGISRSAATSLFDALLSLYVVKANSGRSAKEVVQDVADALKGFSAEDNVLRDDKASTFRIRLEQLLSIDAVELCAKATALQTEYQKIFGTARVMTDIRPVFGADVTIGPVSALIVHSLKIEYLESTQQKEVYFALSQSDIDDLLGILNRAKTKTQSLKKMASSSALTIIDFK